MNASERLVASPRTLADPPPEHLVEAATALAKLMGSSSSPSSSTTEDRSNINNSAAAAAGGDGSVGMVREERSVVSDTEEAGDTHGRGRRSSSIGPLRSTAAAPSPDNNKARGETFPHKLMSILNDPTVSDAVSWLPHGKSFVIIRPDVFTERVLPTYLPPVDARSSTKYPSFTRKLNRWGFRQATRGPDTGAFHHPLFRRDQPELMDGMVCQRSRDRSGTSSSSSSTSTKAAATKAASSKRQLGTPSTLAASTPTTKAPPTTSAAVASLPSISPNGFGGGAAAASVTDDSRSDDSLSTEGSTTTGTTAASTTSHYCCARIPKGITTDQAVVVKTLQQRDELERLRVAKAMLYQSYLEALHNTTTHSMNNNNNNNTGTTADM